MARKSAYVSIGKVLPCISTEPPRYTRRIQIRGPARINTGRHGTMFLCACRHGEGIFDTFGSTCHGAGRVMSRNQAMKIARGRSIAQELKEKGYSSAPTAVPHWTKNYLRHTRT